MRPFDSLRGIHKPRRCLRCAKLFMARAGSAKYCVPCRPSIRAEQQAASAQRRMSKAGVEPSNESETARVERILAGLDAKKRRERFGWRTA
jgi:hypothetical protein